LLGPIDLHQAYCQFPLHQGGRTNCGLSNFQFERVALGFKVCQGGMGLVGIVLQVSIVILQNLILAHRRATRSQHNS